MDRVGLTNSGVEVHAPASTIAPLEAVDADRCRFLMEFVMLTTEAEYVISCRRV